MAFMKEKSSRKQKSLRKNDRSCTKEEGELIEEK